MPSIPHRPGTSLCPIFRMRSLSHLCAQYAQGNFQQREQWQLTSGATTTLSLSLPQTAMDVSTVDGHGHPHKASPNQHAAEASEDRAEAAGQKVFREWSQPFPGCHAQAWPSPPTSSWPIASTPRQRSRYSPQEGIPEEPPKLVRILPDSRLPAALTSHHY